MPEEKPTAGDYTGQLHGGFTGKWDVARCQNAFVNMWTSIFGRGFDKGTLNVCNASIFRHPRSSLRLDDATIARVKDYAKACSNWVAKRQSQFHKWYHHQLMALECQMQQALSGISNQHGFRWEFLIQRSITQFHRLTRRRGRRQFEKGGIVVRG